MAHPMVDTEVSGYRAVVEYQPSDAGFVVLPGWHDSYEAALTRSRKVAAAMLAAGEMGVSGAVYYSGVRPAGMQRNLRVA